jgi:hypothetical protein
MQEEENIEFHHSSNKNKKNTHAIQQRLNTRDVCDGNDDINAFKLLKEISSVVTKSTKL